jgi:xanthine dehydrogenase accessory factor
VTDVLAAARALADAGGTGALATEVAGDRAGVPFLVDASGKVLAGEPGGWLTPEVVEEIARRIDREASGVVPAAGSEIFLDVITPPPTLRLFGAGPIAEALCRLAARAGFRVVVGDPRAAHALPERYPDAVTVSCGWPEDLVAADPFDRRTFVVSLLHIERFEDPLLPLALRAGVRYLGALGSRKTHAARLERLRAAGHTPEELDRIHGPVGLSIGAVTPEEIAVAILAEMVQVRRSERSRESRVES